MTRKATRGSHRSQERRTRGRLRANISKQRAYIAELGDLLNREQILIDELDSTPPRSDEVARFDEIDRRKANHTMVNYMVQLQKLRDATADVLGVLDEMDALDSRPRLLPVRDVKSATTDDHITSLLDGSQFQILTRSLDVYSISADDYRRLFGLPDDYLLWTKKVQDTRRGVVMKHEVWLKRKVRKDSDAAEGSDVEGSK